MKIELTAEQVEQFKKEGKITIEMPKEKEKINVASGWFVDKDCSVFDWSGIYSEENYNVYATKEQAEASIAQARLTQEMKLVNGDWAPDCSGGEEKFAIVFNNNDPVVGWIISANRFLTFKDKATAEKFLSDHYDLIVAYKPLA